MTARSLSVRRPEIVLLLLLSLCLVVLSLQVRRPDGQTAGERWLLDASTPFVWIVTGVRSGANDVSEWAATRAALVRENRQLRRRLDELEAVAVRLRDAEQDRGRLLELFGSYPAPGPGAQAARLIALDVAGTFRTALLDRGGADGVLKGGVVVAHDGLVGRVVAVAARTARVQLLSDRSAAVGVVLQRGSRAAVAHGDEAGGVSVLYVPRISDVAAGDLVVTSGTDGIYPKDLPVGRIEAVKRDGHNPLFLDLPVTLAANPYRESLVFVLPPLPRPEPVTGSTP